MNKVLLILFAVFQFTSIDAFVSNDSCFQAFEIQCGTVLISDWSSATNNDRPLNVCEYTSRREGVWYSILGTGDLLKVSLCNYTTDVDVFEGVCSSLICTDEVIDHNYYKCESSSSEISFLSVFGKRYYLYCTTLNPQLGSRLEITCVEPAINDKCDTAIEMTFDSSYSLNHLYASTSQEIDCSINRSYYADLWFKIKGKNNHLLFSEKCDNCRIPFNLYTGDCESIECVDIINTQSGEVFFASEGETYYLQLLGQGVSDLQFSLDEFSFAENDSCEGAILYNLGDTLEFDTRSATRDIVSCIGSQNYGIWYSLIGNDSVVSIGFKDAYNMNVSILSNVCTSNDCIDPTISSSSNVVSFLSSKDSIYKLLISGRNSGGSFFSTSMEEALNNEPEFSKELLCADSLIGTLKGATSNFGLTNNYRPSVWYRITGTDEFYSFEVGNTNSYNSFSTFLYKQISGDLTQFYTGSYPYYYLMKDSVYYLNVSGRTEASFYIKAICNVPEINDVCSDAILTDLQDSILGSTIFSNIESTESCGYSATNRKDVWYKFIGDGYLKDLYFSSSGHRLAIFSGDCDKLNCELGGFNKPYWAQPETQRFYFKKDTIYYLKFFNYNGNSVRSQFKLSAINREIAENDICNTSTLITCGSVILDSLDFAVKNEFDCEGLQSYRGGVWYSLEGQGKYYHIMHSSPYDFDLTFYKGTCDGLVCFNDSLKSLNGREVFFGEEGVQYYFMINSGGSPYRLEIDCSDPLFNDDISQAIPITCGEDYKGYSFFATYEKLDVCQYSIEAEDIWFSIEGNDEFLYINEEEYYKQDNFWPGGVYTNVIGGLVCYSNFVNNRVFLPSGQKYFIRFYRANNRYAIYDYDINFDCHPKVGNDDCQSALLMNCGDKIIFDRTHATNDEDFVACGGTVPGSKAVWFKVIGDDSWKNFVFRDSIDERPILQIWTYEGDCDELVCSPFDEVFFAKEGEVYYLAITNGYLGLTEVSLTCHKASDNDLCADAHVLVCGDSLSATLNFAHLCDSDDPCINGNYERKVWYKFQGTGDLINLKFKSYAHNSHTANLNVYESGCCIKKPINSSYGKDQNSMYFQSKAGEDYLISVRLGAVNNNGNFDLSVTCHPPDFKNTCESGPEIQNGQSVVLNPKRALNYIPFDNFHYDDFFSWVTFVGSGGVDTLYVKGISTRSISSYFYLDFNGLCELSGVLSNSTSSIYQSSDSLVSVVHTLPGQKYTVAIKESHYYLDMVDTLIVTLKHDFLIDDGCDIEFPSEIVMNDQIYGLGYVDLNGSPGPFRMKIADPSFGNNFVIENSQQIEFRSQVQGMKVLDYYSEECAGQVIFNFNEVHQVVNCRNYVVELDSQGEGSLSPAEIDDSSWGECGFLERSLSKSHFSCADIGQNEVVMTVVDFKGNEMTCTSMVTVQEVRIEDVVITGPSVLCSSTNNIPFSVNWHPNINWFYWEYTGSDASIGVERSGNTSDIRLNLGENASSGDLKLSFDTYCRFYEFSTEHSVTIRDDEFCRFASCLKNKLDLSQESIELIDSIDFFGANEEVLSNVFINENKSVIYRAGESIQLLPGFEVEDGALFIAEIKECLSGF